MFDNVRNGTNDRDNDVRLKLFDYLNESEFVLRAFPDASFPIQLIDGFRAQINQITTKQLEVLEKVLLFETGNRSYECLPDGAVQTRVGVVKEST